MKISAVWPRLRQDSAGIGLLALLAVVLGLAVNHFREKPLPLLYHSKAARLEEAIAIIRTYSSIADQITTAPAPISSAKILSLEEFKRNVESSDVMIIDARPEIFYQLGHVPRAFSLPRDNFEAAYTKLKIKLERDKRQRLAVYCSDADCEDSQMIADALLKLGFQRVSLFKGGWAGWTAARLAQEKAQ